MGSLVTSCKFKMQIRGFSWKRGSFCPPWHQTCTVEFGKWLCRHGRTAVSHRHGGGAIARRGVVLRSPFREFRSSVFLKRVRLSLWVMETASEGDSRLIRQRSRLSQGIAMMGLFRPICSASTCGEALSDGPAVAGGPPVMTAPPPARFAEVDSRSPGSRGAHQRCAPLKGSPLLRSRSFA